MENMQAEEIRKLFGSNVRSRRRELGLTQQELADRLKVSQPYVASIEGGDKSPSIEVFAAMAEALQTTPSALLSTENIFSQTA
jgi:HTH-type transcriptional regulator / antitoxin HipB